MDRETAQKILDDVRAVGDARIRFMIGGWLVYVEDVLVGQIQGSTLFIKETPFSAEFAPILDRRPPYGGARPALVIPENRREDAEWLSQLIQGTVTALRSRSRGRGHTRDRTVTAT